MFISTDDLYRGALLGIAGIGTYLSKRGNEKVERVKIIVNGRSDRMQKRIEELTALCVANGIDVPQLETSSAEPTDAQQRISHPGGKGG